MTVQLGSIFETLGKQYEEIDGIKLIDDQYKVDVPIKNDCINGTFDVWQRGTSQTVTGYSSDDRWYNQSGGTSKTHSRKHFNTDIDGGTGTYDSQGVPGNPRYFSRTVVSSLSGALNNVHKQQRILDVRKYSGKRVVVKFHAKADATKQIAIEGVQVFGSGGSTAVTGISPQKVTLSTTWQKFVVFVDFPSISGKTIGDFSLTQFNFWFDAGSNFDTRTDSLGQQSGTFDIAEVEIYASDVELPVYRPTYEETLDECYRYYWQGNTNAGLGYNRSDTAVNAAFGIKIVYPKTMIRTPTVWIGNVGTYENCTHRDLVSSNSNKDLLQRVDTAAADAFRVLDEMYYADAEI